MSPGFESLLLRQKEGHPNGVSFLLAEQQRIRKDGPTEGRVKKCPVDTFLVRGRIHRLMNAPSMGVSISLLFVAVEYRNSIYSVQQTQKEGHPVGVSFFFRRVAGIRKSDPSCRGQLGRRRLDGGETTIFCAAENANESLLLHPNTYLLAGGIFCLTSRYNPLY